MNMMTIQCRSVSSTMPLSPAIAWAICSFHCAGVVRKPSASTSTGELAIRVMVIVLSPCSGADWGAFLACGWHRRADTWDLPAGQQGVPVDPLEHQLAQVVESRFAQQRQSE